MGGVKIKFFILGLAAICTLSTSAFAVAWKVSSVDLVAVSNKKIFCYRNAKTGKRYIGQKGKKSHTFVPYSSSFQSSSWLKKKSQKYKSAKSIYNIRYAALKACKKYNFSVGNGVPTPTITPGASPTPTESPTSNLLPNAQIDSTELEIVGNVVVFDGSGSRDPENQSLIFEWALLSKPNSSLASLTNTQAQETSLIPDQPGVYTVQLRVSDGLQYSESRNVQLQAARGFHVGPARGHQVPSSVSSLVQDGDTVLIDAGIYSGDVARWNRNGLTLKGVGGYAHLDAAGQSYGNKAIWVVQGDNTTIENIEFSGCSVPDHNGAGIRQEGINLIVKNSYFHHNEDGILAGANPSSTIIIQNSIFEHNGYPDGRAHNIYINQVAEFWLMFSDSSLAAIGHNVKSRALRNFILYNRIMDEQSGTASYEIDLPNGGTSYVVGNVIQQGPATDNPTIITFSEEGATNPGQELFVINNTIVNDRGAGGTFIRNSSTVPAVLTNNLLVGPGTFVVGPSFQSSNIVAANATMAGLSNAAAYNYSLLPNSPAIDAGINPGTGAGLPLSPTEQYLDQATSTTRPVSGAIDVGALEFVP